MNETLKHTLQANVYEWARVGADPDKTIMHNLAILGHTGPEVAAFARCQSNLSDAEYALRQAESALTRARELHLEAQRAHDVAKWLARQAVWAAVGYGQPMG